MKRENNISNQFSIQFVFIMILFLIIVFLSVMIINLGQSIYSNINNDRSTNYELRVALSYIANKIRQADIENTVDIKDLNGNLAVVINEIYDGMNYETWIYYYNNYLYEILIDKGELFEPSDGMKVLKVDGFNISKIRENLFKFSVNAGNRNSVLVLSPYSHQ
nr:DUF4860 domain-containing protein [Sedimentibacter sp.]